MIIYQILFATLSIIFLFSYYYTIGFFLYPILFCNKKESRIRLNENIFLGLIANILFLYSWNLFFPINGKVFLIFILICLLIGIKSGSLNDIKNIAGRFRLKFFIFIVTISIWLGFLSNNPIGPYDLGLYHLQVIKWAESFHVIKGIGNLHHRLGYSCSSWLLSSQFNAFFETKLFLWTHGAIYLLIGFINFLYVPVFSKIQIKKSEKIIRVLYLPILVNLCFSSFPGTSSDLPVFLFTSIISLYYFKFICCKENNSLNMILVILVLGVSSKLTFGAVIIGLIIPFTFIIMKRRVTLNYLNRGIILLSFSTFILWSCRNVIMTGYPLYPYAGISFPVEWKMDRSKVEREKNQVIAYARDYADLKVFDNKERLSWYLNKIIRLQHRKIEIYYPLIIGIFGLFYSIVFINKKLYQIIILVLPSLVPIFLWIQIPGSRFFSSSFWWFGIMLLAFPITRMMKNLNYIYFYLLIIILSISVQTFDRLGSPKNFFPMYVRSKIPNIAIQKITNTAGMTYFSPKDGDQCWDSPLPCSPEQKFWIKNIIQNNKNELKRGFKLKKSDK